jgi:hypothetical protein
MTSRLHRQRSLFHNIATGNRRVPHVRPSVRGPKMMGAAQRSLSLHRSPGWTVQQSHQVPQEIQGSEVEGSAVRPSALPNSSSKTSTPKQKCHPACPGLPWDRSEAKWRDLQFRGPLLEMSSTDRSGEIPGYRRDSTPDSPGSHANSGSKLELAIE